MNCKNNRSLGVDAHLTIVDLFGMEIRDFTGSTRAVGRLLEKKMKKKNMMTKIRVLRMSVFSWEDLWPNKAFLWLEKGL